MDNPKPAPKSHPAHAEEHEPDLNAAVWISQFQHMVDDLPQGKQETKHLHVQSLYYPDRFNRLNNDEKESAGQIRNVSFSRFRGWVS